MWRMCRKTIFPRWHANRQNPVENKKRQSESSKSLTVAPVVNERRYSEENSKQKQHADKQGDNFWDDPQFQYYSIRKSLLETVGWVGTAVALCLNIHHKHYNRIYHYDRPRSSCIFSKLAHAMPHGQVKHNVLPLNSKGIRPASGEHISKSHNVNTAELHEKQNNSLCNTSDSIVQNLQKQTLQYMAALENSNGYQKLNIDDNISFQSFQASAELGSAQGFYNLGLCYEHGKGTKADINKSAYCYRQAAIKGHGLASYNLAIYFLKGLGGLPVDRETAVQLMLEAADQGIPEAQLYLGIEYLEQEMWTDAFTTFCNLSNKNNIEGKYHLGLCYENGWGVNKNDRLAIELFSQAANHGHTEATLSLGKCFEEGRGNIDQDQEFAFTLYQMLEDNGSKEGKDAAAALKRKMESSCISVLNPKGSLKPPKNMHISASVPELTYDRKSSKDIRTTSNELTTPEYLDLILPFIPLNDSKVNRLKQTDFYIGEEKLSIHPANIQILSYQTLGPQLMTART